ncbi:glycosyltransferase [Flavicella sediminum]|uniref:glycosyltransferase n=1 Tax=Flavicella sediminum TaxID=2585141 RepID=UPI00111D3351|nr:glycosyltransferase [Flavicella sediminum]
MRILLVGEYSRLHNSLKEGLTQLGHKVVIIGTGDAFKKYPVDVNIESVFFKSGLPLFIKRVLYKLFNFDLRGIEQGLRFYTSVRKLGNFDIVQLINEEAIDSTPKMEILLLKFLSKRTKKMFLLSCGTDHVSVSFANAKKVRYSILTPFFNGDDPDKSSYNFVFKYLEKPYVRLHQFLYKNVNGVIATDLDYHIPLLGNPKYIGMIPNPINCEKLASTPFKIQQKIRIFHGINSGNYYRKGNYLFEEALRIVLEKKPNNIEVISTRDLPYDVYIKEYNNCHICLDQVYGFDQGYNALEAMAKGKVVFTGAESEFLEYYHLEKNEVCINALPNAKSMAAELEALIENPNKILEISKNARAFIQREHHYIQIAEKYVAKWNEY